MDKATLETQTVRSENLHLWFLGLPMKEINDYHFSVEVRCPFTRICWHGTRFASLNFVRLPQKTHDFLWSQSWKEIDPVLLNAFIFCIIPLNLKMTFPLLHPMSSSCLIWFDGIILDITRGGPRQIMVDSFYSGRTGKLTKSEKSCFYPPKQTSRQSQSRESPGIKLMPK